MRAAMLAFCCLLLTEKVWAQAKEIPPSQKKYYIASDIATIDEIPMIAKSDTWIDMRQWISGFKLYHQNVWPNPPQVVLDQVGPNTANAHQRADTFRNIRMHYQLDTELEVGFVKPQHCMRDDVDLMKAVNDLVDSLYFIIVENGGEVTRLAGDTSMGNCGYDPATAAIKAARFIATTKRVWKARLQQAKDRFPGVRFYDNPIVWGDIEAYPLYGTIDHAIFIEKLTAELSLYGEPPLSFYYLDVDLAKASEDRIKTEFGAFAAFLQGKKMDFGLILNGADTSGTLGDFNASNRYWFLTANSRLETFKRLDVLRWVNLIMIQSWSQRSGGVRDFHYNIPEYNDYTLTNFAHHAKHCVEATSLEVCSVYPEPR